MTDCRGVIRRRDNEIRDLTQVTNKLEEKINDVSSFVVEKFDLLR